MKISFSESLKKEADALALFAGDGPTLGEAGKNYDKVTGGALTRAFKAGRFSGQPGQVITVMAPANLGFSRIVVAGLGKLADADRMSVENAGAAIAATLLRSGEEKVSVLAERMPGAGFTGDELAEHAAIGVKLRGYHFSKYHTTRPLTQQASLKEAVIVTGSKGAAKNFESTAKVLDGVFLTRDLTSEPANVVYPESFAKHIKALEADGLEVEILSQKQLEKMGFRALLAVGQGSDKDSLVGIMKWNGGKKGDAPVAFVGKGVTFDTGGISLKPGSGMEEMKWDMGGAGIVTGTMKALAARKAKANVVGIVGLVENMPSGTAQRPGDVVKSLSGQTIEVINTDAEGRLVLADCLWYCQDKFKPRVMIDLATLTGAIIVSLGKNQYAGMFTPNDDIAEALDRAGKKSGDKVWRMPLSDLYDKIVNCDVADLRNSCGAEAGSITAAQFLKRFTNNTPWAHIDVAGMVWAKTAGRVWDKGATGYGVRLLDQYVRDNFEGK